jgi:orc1/cdc6 family replication initiation protein
MILDARVLDPEFVPREVVHRDSEVDALSNALSPVTDGEPADTALLFGPSGTGKTCLARYTVGQLRETVIDVRTQYVNCWQNYSRYRVLYSILEGLDLTIDIHRQSTPTDVLLERVQAYDGPPFVVVLDEVDQLEDTGVLYDLYRTHGVSMVLVANREEDLFAGLDDRLVSRLHGSQRVRFEKYGVDELAAILRARVIRGLTEDAVDDANLRYIADAAAGDARIAISTLRTAARVADRQGMDSLPESVIVDAVPEAREEIQRKNLDQLKPHQKVLYEIIEEHETIAPGTLYERYREQVADPRSDRTLRTYLNKLATYDLVVPEGENRGRIYRLASQES